MARKLEDEYDPIQAPNGQPVWELPFGEFVERVSLGRHKDPLHFQPFVDRLKVIEALTNAEDVWAAPVQHGKTTLIEYAVPYLLLRHPRRSIIYITFAQRKAEKHSRQMRKIYLQAGGHLQSDFNTIQEWKTSEGGGLFATSSSGEVTGNPATHVFYDDPYKDRQEADNADMRELIEEKFSSEVVTRLSPGGSITILASRWHDDDLSGVKIRAGFVHTHLRAVSVNEDGERMALCPWGPNPEEPRDLDFLDLQRSRLKDDQDWFSLFQGEPRSKNAGLFRAGQLISPEAFARLNVIQWFVGLDLAWSSRNDKIALVALGVISPDLAVVAHVATWQKNVLEMLPEFRAELSRYPTATIGSYVAGPEVGLISALFKLGKEEGGAIRVHKMNANVAKHIRAGYTARRWNNGHILVLDQQPWTVEFLRRVTSFTGLATDKDDEADALVGAVDLVRAKGAISGASFKL